MKRSPKSQNYNFDRLLRNFRNKCKRDGKLEKLREKEHYEKPAQRKQRVKNAAIRREAKRNRDEMLRPQRGFVSKSRKR
jgi:small subunit ribosomal protein S21